MRRSSSSGMWRRCCSPPGSPLTVETMLGALGLPDDPTVGATGGDGLDRPGGRVLPARRREASSWSVWREVGFSHQRPLPRSAVSAACSSCRRTPASLSPAAMECLAVIAYLQPVSRPQIAEVRGVNSDSTVHTLLERELITEVGRSSAAEAPCCTAPRARFEAMFGLAGLDELPPSKASP